MWFEIAESEATWWKCWKVCQLRLGYEVEDIQWRMWVCCEWKQCRRGYSWTIETIVLGSLERLLGCMHLAMAAGVASRKWPFLRVILVSQLGLIPSRVSCMVLRLFPIRSLVTTSGLAGTLESTGPENNYEQFAHVIIEFEALSSLPWYSIMMNEALESIPPKSLWNVIAAKSSTDFDGTSHPRAGTAHIGWPNTVWDRHRHLHRSL